MRLEDLPTDIRSALENRADARAAYERLPPSHRTEYLRWIEEAKKPPTRERRIVGMVERLTAPKGT